jgi:uncharacterized membrane protein
MGTRALRSAFILSIIALAGCDAPASVSDPGLEIAAARAVSGPSYSAQEVGFLPGHSRSSAMDVNDLGYTVGISYPASGGPSTARAFIKTGSTMSVLGTGLALAVSDGSPVYVAGREFSGPNDRVARWTFDPVTRGVTEEIIEELANVSDINSGGTIIGTTVPWGMTNGVATIVPLSGSAWTIPATSGYTGSTARGINDAGHVSVTFHGTPSRAHLLVDGTLIELPPADGHTMSFGGEVSEPAGGFVYASGVSAANVENDYHLARWKVDLANKVVVSVEARREVSEGRGVANDGTVPGMIESRGSSSAVAWTLSGTIALKPTKGGGSTFTENISANGRYIAGSAIYKGGQERGLIWTRSP